MVSGRQYNISEQVLGLIGRFYVRGVDNSLRRSKRDRKSLKRNFPS